MADALNPLVEKVRATYPGAYDDVDDATLTKKVLAKYPQYSDLAAPAVPKPAAPEGLQPPQTFLEKTGERIHQNVDLPAQIHNIGGMVGKGIQAVQHASPAGSIANIPASVAGTLRGAYTNAKDFLSQYKDPANIAGDVITGYMAHSIGQPNVPTAEAAVKPAPAVDTSHWGKGGFGTPVDLWGSRIPPVESPAAPIAVSSPPVAPVATGLKGVEPALEQATGATKLKPDVPLREQLTKQPEHMGQFARANGVELDKALNAEQKAKVHALTNVQVRQLAINLGEDMGQDVIGRAKASGAVPRAEVFGRLLKDHTPAEIVKAIDAGKHLPEAQ